MKSVVFPFLVSSVLLSSGCQILPREPLPDAPATASPTADFDWAVVNNFRPYEQGAREEYEQRRLFSYGAFSMGSPRLNGTLPPGDEVVLAVDSGGIAVSDILQPKDGFTFRDYLRYPLAMFDLDAESTYTIRTPGVIGPYGHHFDEIKDRYTFDTGFEEPNPQLHRIQTNATYYTPAKRVQIEVFSNVAGECDWVATEPSTGIEQFRRSSCRQEVFSVRDLGLVVEVTPLSDLKTRTIDLVVKEKTVVAVGDSFIAGEGVPRFQDPQCSGSIFSWPYLVTAMLATTDPKTIYTIINRGCTGARIEHLIDEPYAGKGQNSNRFGKGPELKQSQIKQAKADLCNTTIASIADCTRTPDYVFLSIGGNNAGFSKVIKNAVLKKVTKGQLAIGIKDRNTDIQQRYKELADEFDSIFPKARIYATNYINPLRRYNGELCDDNGERGIAGKAVRTLASVFGVQLSTDEMGLLESEFIEPLLGEKGMAGMLTTFQRESAGRWVFVKTYHSLVAPGAKVDQTFSTRGICEGGFQVPYSNTPGNPARYAKNSWFNALEDVDDENNFSGLVHPNIFGQLYYARRMLETICEVEGVCVRNLKQQSDG